ncbi:hypothetical protein [Microbacterium sp. NPDC089696]|uniref:hypothetical protein n=1 Tax=Microbacterium sp. NPDC089696 TaxID=3364199 RepID=UPI0037F53B3F
MTDRQLRLLRAAAASSIATVLAAVSHTVAGGSAPHPLLVVAMTALLVPVAAVLIGVRPSRVRVALTVLVSQIAFHLVFALLGAPTAGLSGIGHQHHLDLAAFGPVAAVAAPDALMIGAHLVAAIVTIALLWRGESLIRAIAQWIVARLRSRATSVCLPHRRRPLPTSSAVPVLRTALATSLSRRGPPALV